MTHQQTNVEFVTELMEYSRYGALIQAFVISAIDNYSGRVAAMPAMEFDNPMINGSAWHGCAVEIQRKLKERLKTCDRRCRL